jgi:hypothetical protein
MEGSIGSVSMAYFIKGREQTVGALLGTELVYRMPAYQRPYAWPKELALQLLDDIASAMRRARSSPRSEGDYYLGNIVLSRPDGGSFADVIDGQQRLITLTLLLALLRDRGGVKARAAANAIADHTGYMRVTPRGQDAAFLRQYVQQNGATSQAPDARLVGASADDDEAPDMVAAEAEDADEDAAGPGAEEGEPSASDEAEADDDLEDEDDDEMEDAEPAEFEEDAWGAPTLAPAHDSQRAILDNREALRKRLAQLIASGGLTAESLIEFLLNRCHVVQVLVGSDAQAHRVFIAMHTRGLDLTDTDVLKSQVLGAIPDTTEALNCQQLWETWEARLGRDEFRALFSHIRMIKRQNKAKRGIFAEIHEVFEPERRPAEFIRLDVAPAAARLEAIRKGIWSCERGTPQEVEQVNRRLVRLGLLPHSSWVPVAMRLLEQHGEDAGTLLKLVQKLDALAYGMFILDPLDARIRRFASILRAIDEDKTPNQLASGMSLTKAKATDLARKLTNKTLKKSPVKRLVVLRRLDAEHVAAIGPLPSYADTNIEHVLPQSPRRKSQWRRSFPNWADYVQSLGNVLVIPKQYNARLGNNEFDVKKLGAPDITGYREIHEKLGLGLLPAVLAEPAWTQQVVSRRQRELEDLLLKLWGLSRPGRRRRPRRR